uniref:Gelsolin-like domain-containing protein n=1 Tax=Capra hircus TaxID=9925 RepID=A0A8C2QXF9_CAPHI
MYSPIPQSSSPFPPTVKLPGLHIWRVEKLKPVPVAPENYGIFFSGDSYLVLHLWIGQQSSRDEQGACAVLAVHLNTLLGERPVQHRESQGNESDLFMSYFPRGLKYQEGGVESAFHKTSPGTAPAAVKKLYQVKGKKNIRATERVLSWDSFNTGDCFILDLGQNIFAWCGAKSNILERNKARDLALAIRDSERQGKAHVEIITDGEEPADMIQVLGPKPSLKEGNPEEDLTADRTNAQAAALYKGAKLMRRSGRRPSKWPRTLSPACGTPQTLRWRFCPRAARVPSSSNSSRTGSEGGRLPAPTSYSLAPPLASCAEVPLPMVNKGDQCFSCSLAALPALG